MKKKKRQIPACPLAKETEVFSSELSACDISTLYWVYVDNVLTRAVQNLPSSFPLVQFRHHL